MCFRNETLCCMVWNVFCYTIIIWPGMHATMYLHMHDLAAKSSSNSEGGLYFCILYTLCDHGFKQPLWPLSNAIDLKIASDSKGLGNCI